MIELTKEQKEKELSNNNWRAEVKRENNLATTSVIASCCRQEIKTAYGYKWSYTPL